MDLISKLLTSPSIHTHHAMTLAWTWLWACVKPQQCQQTTTAMEVLKYYFMHSETCLHGPFLLAISFGVFLQLSLLIWERANEISLLSLSFWGSELVTKYKVKVEMQPSSFLTSGLVFSNVYQQCSRWGNRDGCAAITASHSVGCCSVWRSFYTFDPRCWWRQRSA